ncbi:MAG: AzlC family ABC transporter permease [Ruminococcus sp.]|nr:AzlC family ABC transporter permease [Ruminococcus sp.]
MKRDFLRGMRHGIPIMLGYLSVSFGFGINAVALGLTVLQTVGISLTNLTSAGQAAGVSVIAAGGTLLEMALCQLVVNLRYSLMGFALSRRLSPSFTTPHRLVASFGITDEIFAVASAQPEPLTPFYLYGIEIISIFGWTLGTALGALGGALLPSRVTAALGLMLYGMFIAIIIPPAKRNYKVLIVILLSAGLSVIVKFCLTFISEGFSVIICALASSVVCALIFPHEPEEKEAGV